MPSKEDQLPQDEVRVEAAAYEVEDEDDEKSWD